MRAFVLVLSIYLAGCATPVVNSRLAEIPSSTPVRWKVAAGCMASYSLGGITTREQLAAVCPEPGKCDFIALALSGGGTKAAVFSGEVMFYLQALGLLQRTDMVSSVSGGSFAGALYALSCDETDRDCIKRTRPGLTRPLWRHDEVLRRLGAGYRELVREQVVRLVVPIISASISADRFAQVIDANYLGRASGATDRFTFADLNPRRPHLFMNATILSRNRGGLESRARNGCPDIARGYLRRRTPDEFFHFAFSDYYFNLLKSSLADYPVAASAAFPALIDNAILRDHCGDTSDRNGIRLMDGGANDNQALIEVYMVLSELALRQARSDLSVHHPERLERLGRGDRAWFVVVNASVTESTGQPGTTDDDPPWSAPGVLLGVVDKVVAATDTYSAIGWDLRRQLYLSDAERLHADPHLPRVVPVDIWLTSLDQYVLGGTEAALRSKSMIGPEASDLSDARLQARIARQSSAYRLVEDRAARTRLRLSDWHPQCYYAMRAQLDASLVSVAEDDQACLREAARWSVALRAQELCDGAAGIMPDGLLCVAGQVQLREPRALSSGRLPGTCRPKLDALPYDDPRLACRALD